MKYTLKTAVSVQTAVLLYAESPSNIQSCCRKRVNTTTISVQVCVYRYWQNSKTSCISKNNSPNTKFRSEHKPFDGLCKRHLHVLVLHPRNVVHWHGISEKERSAEWSSVLCRHKTDQQLFIKWEKPMQKIVDKYNTIESSYLLPIIKNNGKDPRREYKMPHIWLIESWR